MSKEYYKVSELARAFDVTTQAMRDMIYRGLFGDVEKPIATRAMKVPRQPVLKYRDEKIKELEQEIERLKTL